MTRAALKALFFRYIYMLSHRDQWLTRLMAVVYPILLAQYLVLLDFLQDYEKFNEPETVNDQESLRIIPWQMKIVVCPDGPEERRLMGDVNSFLCLDVFCLPEALIITYVQSEHQMVDQLASWRLMGLAKQTRGVHFHEITDTKLEYTLRPQVPNDTVFMDWGAYRTAERFPSPMLRGPREDQYFNVYRENEVFIPGIIQLQVAIDRAYIDNHVPDVTSKWLLRSFPYPEYTDLKFKVPINLVGFTFSLTTVFLVIFPFIISIGLSNLIAIIYQNIIKEKMSGVRELFSINGAPRWTISASWSAAAVAETTMMAFAHTLMFKVVSTSALQYMTSPVLFIVLIAQNLSSIAWVTLLASVFLSDALVGSLIPIWWILTPYAFQFIPPDRFFLQGLLAILPNAGFILILKAFQEFDGAETQLGLDRLFTHPIHYLPVGMILGIILYTLIMLFILVSYVDFVKPGPFGRALPWYIFTHKQKSRAWTANDATAHDATLFEDLESEDTISLKCVNLYKFFGKNLAVDNINLKIPKNRITVLLGHNGAGKSTLFSILCGMYSPTKGDFYTEHYNVFKGRNIIRFQKSLGYCPQNNLLMDELTAKQHLVVFGLLKGLSRQEAREYSEKWVELFDMEDTQKTQGKALSGGTKRKLSLAIAMISDPEYLMLDEPSSGLDAESIRKFWNLMLQRKSEHTVVLSTHNMEEAEIIGDRIAFMSDGQLKAYGTVPFLKKKLDIGYKLTCASDEKELGNLIKAMKKIIHSASIIQKTNRTVTFGVPSTNSKDIPNLMKSLDSEFKEKVATTLSQSTIDDVYIKLFKNEKPMNLDSVLTNESEIDPQRYFTFEQTMMIIKKRIKWLLNRRLISMIIFAIVLPGVGMVLSLYAIRIMTGLSTLGISEKDIHDLELTLDKYSGSSAFISRDTGDFGGALKSAMTNSGINYSEVDSVVQALREKANEDLFEYRSKLVFGFESRDHVLTAFYSRNAFHAAPIAYSAMINALLQGKATIVTHNFPFARESEACSDQAIVAAYMIVLLVPVMVTASYYFSVFPREENKSDFKQLQLMTGLLPLTYWISNFIFDIAIFLSSCILIIMIIAIMDENLFFNPTVTSAFAVVLTSFGVCQILLTYVSSWFKTRQNQTFAATIYTTITIIGLVILFALLGVFVGKEVLYFLPYFTLYHSLMKISYWAVERRKCLICENDLACATITRTSVFGQLKVELICFAFMSLVYFALILALDHGLGRKLWAIIKHGLYKNIGSTTGEIDPEVGKEKERVRILRLDAALDQPELTCDNLGKKYSRKLVAVRDVTFAAEVGELFGLLGANGAGKSSTFNILSGFISPTRGDASIKGKWDLGDCEYKYIRNIGYSPQFGGLLPGLSGRSILRLFGRLRRVKLDVLDYHVDLWLEALDMNHLADRPCDQYSGGNKKKLNFAVSMIGNPSVVLLDEPTTGIDPIIRRRIWEILTISLSQHNRAIVLSSHAMSECEAICDRLTILLNGQMRCLGSIPKLKNTFGKSFTLHVKLRDGTTPEESGAIQSTILSHFPDHISLQRNLVNLLTFNLKTQKIKIYDAFSVMLNIKEQNPAIDDFSLAETPLEEIFLMFAEEKEKNPTSTK